MFKGLKGLLAGIVAGTALGILFSPKKGEEIRKGLKKEIKDGGTGLNTLKATVSEMGQDISETAKDTYSEVKKSPQYKKGRLQAKKAHKAVKKVVAKAKSKIPKK